MNGGPHLFHLQPRLIGDRDQLFASGLIGSRDDRHRELQSVLRERAGQRIFDCGQTYHFAGDFRKAPQPPQDEDEALGIHLHNVTGVVPAAQGQKSRVGFRIQIALHDVWPAHQQAADGGLGCGLWTVDCGLWTVDRGPWTVDRGPLQPFNRFKSILDARQKLPHRPLARAHGQVRRQAGAAFRRAVAFQNPHAELARPQVDRGLLESFRPGEHVAQRAEVIRVGLARIGAQERVGPEKHGAVQVVEGRRHGPVMQRCRVEEHKDPFHQRQQQADGQSEAVEKRQGAEEPVRLHQVNHRQHLADVCQQVAMRKFHPFGQALRTAGEKHHRRILGTRPGSGARRLEQRPHCGR